MNGPIETLVGKRVVDLVGSVLRTRYGSDMVGMQARCVEESL